MMSAVMVVSALGVVDGAVVLVAVLARSFEFEGGVGNAVLCELFADGVLDVVGIAVGYYVQGGVVVVAIHAPNVDVVHVLYALDVRKMLANFVYVDAVGGLFEEEIDRLFEGADGVDENKHCHTDGHQRIDDGNIGKAHNDCSHEDNQPAEDVLEHVEVDSLLVEGVALTGEESREEVHRRADDGKNNHSAVVDGRGVDDAQNGVVNDESRAHQKDERGQDAADDGVARVAVGKVLVGLLFALFFEEIRGANACGVADIVHGVGYNGNAAGKKAADEFKNRKCEVENKSNENISFGFHGFLPFGVDTKPQGARCAPCGFVWRRERDSNPR